MADEGRRKRGSSGPDLCFVFFPVNNYSLISMLAHANIETGSALRLQDYFLRFFFFFFFNHGCEKKKAEDVTRKKCVCRRVKKKIECVRTQLPRVMTTRVVNG